ncbi:antitoxin VapB [Mycobacterium sp. MFM001]|uniref:type II toxin-antitoxin system VapB family antitoxin n=1 Tax=Mycobacterium sp. MFM001 TaxID=2049453 RepID=UPI000DA58687|nr:type II toxin-antitoxin system VapB family antitoxin [Mycobacterium sp. MFM001]GBE66768.1 antitoxin VapB [Mycobacterium sp. MFM001]
MSFATVEIEIDQTLVDEVIRRYHLRSAREAVNLALRMLVNSSDAAEPSPDVEEADDPFDLDVLDPRRSRRTG